MDGRAVMITIFFAVIVIAGYFLIQKARRDAGNKALDRDIKRMQALNEMHEKMSKPGMYCSGCHKAVQWKRVSSRKVTSFDNAMTVGPATTVFTKEDEYVTFECPECGYREEKKQYK